MTGRVGPHELLDELGRGGLGAVLRARDVRAGQGAEDAAEELEPWGE